MPILNPYVGDDLERYSPTEKTSFPLQQLMETWTTSRALKQNRMKQERDKQILEAIISGQPIPEATPQISPQGVMGRLGEFMTGGRPDVGPSSLETAMAEAAMKNRFVSPTDKLIQEGKVADAQMKIYQAGGPKPSLFNQASPEQSSEQLPLILQNAPQAIQEQVSAGQEPIRLEATGYDEFGRPKGFENPQSEARKQAMVTAEKEKQLNAAKVSRLSNIVDIIEKKYAETKTPKNPLKRAGETFSRKLQVTQNQRTDKAYADFIGGIRAQLARAMGDVGNLSEFEQKAVLELVPNLLDDPRTAEIKIKNMRGFVEQIKAAASQGQGTPSTNNKQDVRAVYNFLRTQGMSAEEAKKRLGL